MKNAALKVLQIDIEKEIATIESELGRFAVKNPVVPDDYQSLFPKGDASDSADEQARRVTSFGEERAVEQNLEVRLKELKDTLRKIAEGSYGLCGNCNNQIEPKRLQAMPAVSLCVNCAQKASLL